MTRGTARGFNSRRFHIDLISRRHEVSYSTFRSSILSFFRMQKKLYKHGEKAPGCPTLEDFHIKWADALFQCYISGKLKYRELIPVFYIDSILFTGCENYYIETMGLYNFLRDTPVKETGPILKNVIKKSRLRGELKLTDCLIHHPDNKGCSVYALASAGGEKPSDGYNGAIGIAFGKDDVASVAFDKLNNPWKTNDENTKEAQKTINMVINLFMYMGCFPECISDSAPEEITQDRKINGKHKTITAHEAIMDRSGVTPHFRKGYFKCLASEYFTKKRGQIIFINSTFVNGKAKTVLESTEAMASMEG